MAYIYRFYEYAEQQKKVFRRQLEIAVAMNKPLVIHCRDAEEECISIMEEVSGNRVYMWQGSQQAFKTFKTFILVVLPIKPLFYWKKPLFSKPAFILPPTISGLHNGQNSFFFQQLNIIHMTK